ncbi:MAG: hypothetical protein WC405_20775 [Syntrophales bacterium]
MTVKPEIQQGDVHLQIMHLGNEVRITRVVQAQPFQGDNETQVGLPLLVKAGVQIIGGHSFNEDVTYGFLLARSHGNNRWSDMSGGVFVRQDDGRRPSHLVDVRRGAVARVIMADEDDVRPSEAVQGKGVKVN